MDYVENEWSSPGFETVSNVWIVVQSYTLFFSSFKKRPSKNKCLVENRHLILLSPDIKTQNKLEEVSTLAVGYLGIAWNV